MDVVLVGSCTVVSAVAFGLSMSMTAGGRQGRPAGELDGPLEKASRSIAEIPAVRALRRKEEKKARRGACLRELPSMLDVVTLGLSSGLSFDASLELYCQRYDDELAAAFAEALLSWRIGAESRQGALNRLADDLEVSALRSFASAVTQSLEFGSPLAATLETQAQAIREEQRSQLEEEIEKVPVKMLIPLGTLIVPAMLLSILGPLIGSSLSLG